MANPVEESMRLAVFLPSLEGGGAERVVVSLLKGFVERQIAVDLVLAKAKGVYLSQVPSSCRIIDLDSRGVLNSLPKLILYLRRERPQRMLSMMSHANIVAIMARFFSCIRFRLVVSERCALAGNYFLGFKGRLLKICMYCIYPFADAIVAVSNGVSDDIRRELNIDCAMLNVIYNPVDFKKIENESSLPCSNDWLNASVPIIIASGRLTKQKDFPTLLKALAKVRAKRDVRLIILGDGEEKDYLKTITIDLGLVEYVFFAGFVRQPYTWFSRASVFVLSSAWEGLPNVLIEAMACGVPVVATDCPHGPKEILENGKWGRLVPVGDAESMAFAILETLKETIHPDVRFRANFFSLTRSVDDYLKILNLTY